MKPAKKENDAFAFKVWKLLQKVLPLQGGIAGRFRDSQFDDTFMAAIEPKGASRPQAFFLAGEQDRPRVAQNAVVRPRPIEPFFQMLQGISLFEPGIEHAMGNDKKGRSQMPQSAPCSKAVILPNSVDDDRIEIICVFAKPWHKVSSKSKFASSRA